MLLTTASTLSKQLSHCYSLLLKVLDREQSIQNQKDFLVMCHTKQNTIGAACGSSSLA